MHYRSYVEPVTRAVVQKESTTPTWAGKQARTKAAALSKTLSRSFGLVITGRRSHVPNKTERTVDQTISFSSSEPPSPPTPPPSSVPGTGDTLVTDESGLDRRRPPGAHSPSPLTLPTPTFCPGP